MSDRKRLPRPWPCSRAAGQAGDVDDLDRGVDLARRLQDLVEPVEALVGHGHHAVVGLGRAEGVRRGQRARVGERVEHGGLAGVGQSDDAELHDAHYIFTRAM